MRRIMATIRGPLGAATGRRRRARHARERDRRPGGYGDRMSDTLPMFPLNTVLFPGMSVPLQVFEDRYRALVHHLLRVEDPTERVFGSVGIREGYEVGEHGAQWLFRVGCRVKMTEVESHADGTFELVAVGLDRIELEHLDTTGAYPVGHVTPLAEQDVAVPDAGRRGRARRPSRPTARRCSRSTASRPPATCRATRRTSPGRWPPSPRSAWPQRQALLEAEDADGRLRMVTDVLRGELRTMRVFPSLPGHRDRPHPLVSQLTGGRDGRPSFRLGSPESRSDVWADLPVGPKLREPGDACRRSDTPSSVAADPAVWVGRRRIACADVRGSRRVDVHVEHRAGVGRRPGRRCGSVRAAEGCRRRAPACGSPPSGRSPRGLRRSRTQERSRSPGRFAAELVEHLRDRGRVALDGGRDGSPCRRTESRRPRGRSPCRSRSRRTMPSRVSMSAGRSRPGLLRELVESGRWPVWPSAGVRTPCRSAWARASPAGGRSRTAAAVSSGRRGPARRPGRSVMPRLP